MNDGDTVSESERERSTQMKVGGTDQIQIDIFIIES